MSPNRILGGAAVSLICSCWISGDMGAGWHDASLQISIGMRTLFGSDFFPTQTVGRSGRLRSRCGYFCLKYSKTEIETWVRVRVHSELSAQGPWPTPHGHEGEGGGGGEASSPIHMT